MSEQNRKGQKVPLESLYKDGKLPDKPLPPKNVTRLEDVPALFKDVTEEIAQADEELEQAWANGEISEEEYEKEKADVQSAAGSNRYYKKKARQDRSGIIARAETAKTAIHSALAFYKQGIDRIESDEELEKRVEKFFEKCENEGWLPTFEKLCLFLGYTKADVNGWENGTKSGFSDRTGKIIRQAKLALAAIDADMVISGQMPSAVYQFRSKIFNGMDEKGANDVPVETSTKSLSQLIEESADLPQMSSSDEYDFEFEKQRKKTKGGNRKMKNTGRGY